MSYTHAAKEIGVKYQSIESAIKRESRELPTHGIADGMGFLHNAQPNGLR